MVVSPLFLFRSASGRRFHSIYADGASTGSKRFFLFTLKALCRFVSVRSVRNLKRNIIVLLPGVFQLFAAEGAQRFYDAAAG